MNIRKFSFALFFTKVIHFEYWPFGIFYIPMYFYGFFLALKSRSFTYFTAANPQMYTGGTIGQSKKEVLKHIHKRYLPATLYIEKRVSGDEVLAMMKENHISFPIVLKPDIGERGMKVEKINNPFELSEYIKNNSFDLILQKFIDYPLELGILYYRFPQEQKGHISSIVKKEFLTMVGDGKTTLEEWVNRYRRAQFQKERLKQNFSKIWKLPLKVNEKLFLEPIGNHCRGTKFLNANQLINDDLVVIFDAIAKNIPQYYYGRFDIKVPSITDLYAGKNIQIMELNGVNSEPAHIYDPKISLFTAYKTVFKHMKIIYIISKQNHLLQGISYLSFWIFMKELYIHLFQRKK